MKAVMISIKPQWCKLIAKKQKTIEVRKTKPKLKTPFKCYIYETKGLYKGSGGCLFQGLDKVIGEFVCDFINEYTAEFVNGDYYEDIRQIFDEGEIIITSNEDENPNNCFLCNSSCLSFDEIKKYIGVNFHEKPFYGWHISDLVIYDKPKSLYEFSKHDNTYNNAFGWVFDDRLKNIQLTRPPYPWSYVEEKE